ncbi:MAG: ribokinase, partial [Luteimonas sp.]
KGFNQAVACARAGADTCFVCALGDDAGGQYARALATADGIDLRDRCSAAPTGTAGIFVDAEGSNSIIVGPGANADLSVDAVDAQRDAIVAAQVLLVQLESPADTVHAALRHARGAGVPTLLNPAPANGTIATAAFDCVDTLTPNESEFCTLLARHLGERVAAEDMAALGTARLHALCRKLLPDGSVVITLGASGCFVSHPEARQRGDASTCYRVGAERAHVIDTTGAGDAFNGALAASIAMNPMQPFESHVRFATRCAALSTERPGAAASMPRLADVVARFGDPLTA